MSSILSIEDQRLAQRLADGGLWSLLQRNWYEEGTFTPSFAGTTTPGVFGPGFARGFYSRQGRRVDFIINLGINGITTPPVGNMEVRGLPIASAMPVASMAAPLTVYTSNLDYPATALEISGRILDGSSAIQLLYTRDNNSIVLYPAASFTNANTLVFIQGFYYVGGV
jgi:hypothetical protein